MKKGFTIVELLIVIMLIGLLAAVTIRSYDKTRQSAELSLLTDQFITDLRELKSKTSNASSKCLGFEIKESGELFYLEATYLNPFEKCDQDSLITGDKYTIKNFKVIKINQSNIDTPLKSIKVLFTPPHGEIYLPGLDRPGSTMDYENITLKLALGDKANDQMVILNRQNNTIQKTY